MDSDGLGVHAASLGRCTAEFHYLRGKEPAWKQDRSVSEKPAEYRFAVLILGLNHPSSVIARFMRATHFVFSGQKDGLPGQAGQ
jgi:hypothetical protein